jgi:N,N'-diacetyllegionaminate synthase
VIKNKVFIIAEAGVNHNGLLETAKKMVDAAKEAGADAVKFQSFKAENIVTEKAPKAEYQRSECDRDGSQLEMLKKLELNAEEHKELKNYCDEKGIMFLSTPFDLKSVDLLTDLGLEIFKIPSGEITNLPYLRKIGRLDKKVIMSTGMATMEEVAEAVGNLVKEGTLLRNITVLHCNTEYPTPFEDVNLRAMRNIKDSLRVSVGYSDHTPGIEVSIAAVALGAEIIEKHFTLDRNMEGPDHRASLEPQELKAMVKAIRNIEKAIEKDGEKTPSVSESKNIKITRKSLVAASEIKKEEIFTENNITAKRPGTGISPMQIDSVIGKKAKKDFMPDEVIEL